MGMIKHFWINSLRINKPRPGSRERVQPQFIDHAATMSDYPAHFETTQDILHAPLDHFEQLAQQLFSSLSQSGLRAPPPPSIDTFLETDAALAKALATARSHQQNQKLIEELSAEILGLDSKLRGVWTSLDEAHKELGAIVEEGEVRLKEIDSSSKGTNVCLSLINQQ